VLIVELCRLSF